MFTSIPHDMLDDFDIHEKMPREESRIVYMFTCSYVDVRTGIQFNGKPIKSEKMLILAYFNIRQVPDKEYSAYSVELARRNNDFGIKSFKWDRTTTATEVQLFYEYAVEQIEKRKIVFFSEWRTAKFKYFKIQTIDLGMNYGRNAGW